MVSNIETKPMETGASCKSFDGGADKYVGSVVAAKGWPSGIISGGKRHRKGKSSRKRGTSRKRSRKAGTCCKGGSKAKKGGFAAMLGKAIIPFGLFAAQKRTQRKGHRGSKSYKKKSFRRRR
jgi:hypothetical protein